MNELRQRRLEKLYAKRPKIIAAFLSSLRDHFVKGNLENTPHAVIYIGITDGEPEVAWAGYPSRKEVTAASWALQKTICKMFPYPQPEDIEEIQKRQEELRRTHPWECRREHCDRCFETERGRNIHERSHKRWDKE